MTFHKNRLLIAQSYNTEIPFTHMFTGLERFRKLYLKTRPGLEVWLPEKTFAKKPIWPEKLMFNMYKYGSNVAGSFLADNISVPTTVLEGDATAEKIIDELIKAKNEGYPYSHVGFSVFIDSYINFVNCSKAVKEFDENITTIAGNVGVLFEDTSKYVDLVCKGDGVRFLRNLFGEDLNKPYKTTLVPTKFTLEVLGVELKSELVHAITKIGCPNKCGFCGTSQLFKGVCSKPFISPQEFHDEIIKYRKSLKKDFMIFMAEPTAVTSKKWWYDLFESFEGEPEDYPVYAMTTTVSMKTFDLDRISKSSLRFQAINLGIESFNKNYKKSIPFNEVKDLIKRFKDHGIGTYASYIIGFDFHDRENVWEEIDKLLDLDAGINSVLNLKPIPGTDEWNRLKVEGRLLRDFPKDLYYVQGFQTFKHPHFKPGFEDMLPLLCDIHEYIEKEKGCMALGYIELYENLLKFNRKKVFDKRIKTYKNVAKALFPSWKKHLNPSIEQETNYLDQLDGVDKIPFYYNWLVNSNRFRNVVKVFTN